MKSKEYKEYYRTTRYDFCIDRKQFTKEMVRLGKSLNKYGILEYDSNNNLKEDIVMSKNKSGIFRQLLKSILVGIRK